MINIKNWPEFTESVRSSYVEMGVENYYSTKAKDYTNPHENQIKKCLDWTLEIIKPGHFLDLSCGNGEVSSYLMSKGFNDLKGSDPYFNSIFKEKTGKECYKLSFEEISTNGLSESFDTIFCSYALHLCPKSYFNNLLYQLSIKCKQFVVISPSKFPLINEDYFYLHDSCIIERTHCRIFKSQ